MRITHAILCASLVLGTIVPFAANAETDACTLLTPAQVAKTIGVPVAAGKHVTPTFMKTCTWTPSGASPVASVTLYLQPASAYDGGKQMAAAMAAHGASMTPASVGDDAYYFVAGEQVGLLVKKGAASFKVSVYATIPLARKEAMELELARQVLGKLG
ncbi:hypothetical protein [Dokdonella sp.]|uniref:hypothetical protein n=1 Tax=Dokdonella sp. TaxID=2291710 RepID=UPI0031C086D1|nr:DUF3558 domain-containing protein [Dokdonella sp.]